jgi:hypothetical protein
MKKSRLHLSPFESVLLTSATALLVLGCVQAYADNPNLLCVGPTKNGCMAALGCPGNRGMCNSMAYIGSETSTFSYRLCNGAAGNCDGWDASYTTCERRFYNMLDCSDTPCRLTTTISACTP